MAHDGRQRGARPCCGRRCGSARASARAGRRVDDAGAPDDVGHGDLRAIRRAFPSLPVVWGGYFPTIYPDAAIHAPYVDYLVRGQGEQTIVELLSRLGDAGPPSSSIRLANPRRWRHPGAHLEARRRARPQPGAAGASPGASPSALLPVTTLRGYLRPSFLGAAPRSITRRSGAGTGASSAAS